MKKPIKLSQEVVNLLLPRLKDEYTAFYTYRAASNWLKNNGFEKAAAYFKAESDDELTHARGLEDYIVDWNVNPILPKIDTPQIEFKGLPEIIEIAYKLEYNLYEEYEDTSGKILKEGDISTFDFLKFYRDIQNKSVIEYSDMLNLLDGTSVSDKFQLLMLEEQLFGE